MSSPPVPPWIAAVIRYWFGEIDPKFWFKAETAIDADIATRFGSLRAELKRAPPAAETLDADGHLAAVVVFDQFSRNLFRRAPEAFATDGLALSYASHAIEAGLDRLMEPQRRMFVYMPFMHSEDRATQARSVALFGNLRMPEQLKYAEHHKSIIDRFGRFPHRNTVLGRQSTDAELAFLRSDPGF